MTKKLIKHSETKATQVSAYEVKGKKYIGIRTMYKTKADPKTWKPGKGIGLEVDEEGLSEKALKRALKMLRDPETEFEKIKYDD